MGHHANGPLVGDDARRADDDGTSMDTHWHGAAATALWYFADVGDFTLFYSFVFQFKVRFSIYILVKLSLLTPHHL